MKKRLTLAVFLCSFLLIGTHAAQATCVIPVAALGPPLFPNDVAVDGFTFEAASIPLSAFEVDMNGVQQGIRDQRSWATHGTLVAQVLPGGQVEFIASWTQNTSVDSVEWVCRLMFTGTPTLVGTGNYHSALFGSGNVIDRCTMNLVADC